MRTSDMRKGEIILAVAAALLLATGSALAESSAAACTAAGGTYTKDGGTALCTFPVGNSDNTKITDQKGSFNSSHPEGLTNPGGTKPPGKQGGNTL